MKNVTFIIWAFVVLCAGCSSSTSVVQDEVSMTKGGFYQFHFLFLA